MFLSKFTQQELSPKWKYNKIQYKIKHSKTLLRGQIIKKNKVILNLTVTLTY